MAIADRRYFLGIAAAMSVLLGLGSRIAGIFGIVGGLLKTAAGDLGWRIAFASNFRSLRPLAGV